jgi:hypothetical protein
MDVQVKAGSLVRTITDRGISGTVGKIVSHLRTELTSVVAGFLSSGISASGMLKLENRLAECVRESAGQILQWLVTNLEPELEKMPGTVKYKGQSFRRLTEKSDRSSVVTSFGNIELNRARYRRGRGGKTIFPLELLLGIEAGFTPAAANTIGKQYATSGSSQGRTKEMILERFGVSIGNEKLRKLTSVLAESFEPLRESTQVEELMRLITSTRESGETPVLSISRDGVALGLAPWSIFEMAGVASISVLSDGKKLGTVYLANTPQANQEDLSRDLTSLLTQIVRACGSDVPKIVYVTDAGKIETAYWKNVLRKFFVDGIRIPIVRVVDYYHASERLTTIAEALKLDADIRSTWLVRIRKLLLEPSGHGRVLRSIAHMKSTYGYKSSLASDARKAEAYLRRYKRFMDYDGSRSQGFPIGSGIVESACKQIVSERMKLSGMRWHRKGAHQVMSLRCILLSNIWSKVFGKWLQSKPTVLDLMPK